MQDLNNDVIYPFFLDVGRPVVSYVEDLAALPMYPLAYRRQQRSLEGSHKDFFVRCITSIVWQTFFFFHIGARSSSLCTDLLPGPFPNTTFISLTISNTIFPQRCIGLVRRSAFP